jgi:hypothetical protein
MTVQMKDTITFDGSPWKSFSIMAVHLQKVKCARNIERMEEIRDAYIFVGKTKGHTGLYRRILLKVF